MIEAVTAVARADAVVVAAGAGQARRTLDGRQRRLRWLDALRAANGGPLPLDEEERDEAELADSRARIRAALATIEELDAFERPGEDAAPPAQPVSASHVARLIAADRAASLAAQAHIGAAAIRRILA